MLFALVPLAEATLPPPPRIVSLPVAQETAPAAGGEAGPEKARPYLMEVNFRGRYVTVPDSILDIWYFNASDDNGNHLPRPKAHGYTVGLEYAIRNETQQGTFYFEYAAAMMEGGYWDDVEDPPDYLDGDYMVPYNFGFAALGANYYYDMRLAPVFSIMVGAGLGVGYVTGKLEKWDTAGSGIARDGLPDGTPAYEVYESFPDDPDESYRIPKVIPIVDINAALKFHFNDRANLRLEGGFHGVGLYGGGAFGIVF